MMINVVPVVHTYIGGYAKVVLVWGIILTVADIIRNRSIVYTPYYKWLIAFIVLYIISIFVNYKNGFIENLSSFLYCIIPLLLLYPLFATASKDKIIKDARIYAKEFCCITFIFCLISVIMFAKQYDIVYNGLFRTGVHFGRLYGVYKSPNSGSLYSLLSILLLCYLAKTRRKRTIINGIVYILIAFINIMYFVLADSNGSNITLFCFVGLLVFLLILTEDKWLKSKKTLRVITAIVLSGIMVIACVISIKVLSKVFSYIPSIVESISNTYQQDEPIKSDVGQDKPKEPNAIQQDDDPSLYSIATGRTYESQLLSGRPDIWLMGVNIIRKFPVFGVGYGDYYEISKSISTTPDNTAVRSGFHNLYVQIAATCGLPCLVSFLAYLIGIGFYILKRLQKQFTKNRKVLYISGVSLLVSLLINNLVEVSITLYYSGIGLVFWAILGCLSNKNIIREEKELDKSYDSNVAFFAATPYQAINAINIRKNCFEDKGADLFIMDYATDILGCYSAVKDSGVFQNVYYIKDPWNKKGRMRFLCSYIFPAQRIMKIISYKKYSTMFGTRIGMANNFYYTHLIKNNEDMTFHYYEEGIGDYISEITPPVTFLVKLSKVLGYKNAFDCVDKLWLYKPEFRRQNMQYDVCTIPAIDSEMSSLLIDIFDKTRKKYLPENCMMLYFDQAYKEQLGIDFDNVRVLNLICEIIDKNDTFIKLHPGSTKDKYDNTGFNVLPNTPLPWEAQLTNLALENILLVSINSTAVITPITMYNRDVNVILLYKCFPDSRFINIDKQEEYFNCIKEGNDKVKLYIPENTGELIADIKRFLDEVK